MLTFLKNLWLKIKAFFETAIPKTKSALDYGVEVANKLNSVINSPIVDYLTYVIPGSTDDVIVAAIRAKLPQILIDLNLVDSAINSKDPNAVIAAAMKTLQAKQGTVQYALLHGIASIVADIAANGDLSWSEIAAIIEDFYQETKK